MTYPPGRRVFNGNLTHITLAPPTLIPTRRIVGPDFESEVQYAQVLTLEFIVPIVGEQVLRVTDILPGDVSVTIDYPEEGDVVVRELGPG